MSAPLSALRAFPLPARAPTWYIGHMHKSMREFPALLRDIDIVIEARDARVPLSGVNVGLEGVVRRSWGLPAVDSVMWRGGHGGSGGYGGTSRLGSHDENGRAGEGSTSAAVAGSGEGQMGSIVDRKGKGKARDWGVPSVKDMTEQEREARLAQIQRQGGRMRERVVVYTKRDLADTRFEEPIRDAFWQYARQRVFFANTDVDGDVREVMRHIIDLAKQHIGLTGNTSTPINILVIGMPNVGKSSLLNALRRIGVKKGKAFRTSAKPGHTRKLTGTVRIHDDPLVYVYDAPGVMMPYLGRGDEGVEKGLKLALTSGMKEGLVPDEVIAEYLLHLLNTYHYPDIFLQQPASPVPPGASISCSFPTAESPATPYHGIPIPKPAKTYIHHLALPPSFQPTDSLADFLDALARRLGALRRGGEPDTDHAQTFFLRMYREGKLGRLTVDDMGRCVPVHGPDGINAEILGDEERDASRDGRAEPAGPDDGIDPTERLEEEVGPANQLATRPPPAARTTGQTPPVTTPQSAHHVKQLQPDLPRLADATTASLTSTMTSNPTTLPTYSPLDPDVRVRQAVHTFLLTQTAALEIALGQDADDTDSPFMSDTQRSKRELERKKAERKEYKARKQAGSMAVSGTRSGSAGASKGASRAGGGGGKRPAQKGRGRR